MISHLAHYYMCIQVYFHTYMYIFKLRLVHLSLISWVILAWFEVLTFLFCSKVFCDIRDRHFSNVFGYLSQKAKDVQSGYDVSI